MASAGNDVKQAACERRRSVRLLCSELVKVEIDRGFPRPFAEAGILEDVSRHGVCVSLGFPLPVGSVVTLEARGFRGRTVVCYCDLAEFGYNVGLEFADGYVWDPADWQPEHLLPLPETS